VRPRIGVTASVRLERSGVRRVFVNEPYLRAVEAAGGVPLVIPPGPEPEPLQALYELLDGLLLTGGEDVAPERYGEALLYPDLVQVVPERDAAELQLLDWALGDRLPTLAICRGVQVLNVKLGGSLYQDLGRDRPGALPHNQAGATPRQEPTHPVTVLPGSFLADTMGAERLLVNSLHHQAIKALAPSLFPVAYAPDGVIEGVEANDPAPAAFLLGVQWHPEELVGHDPAARRLFDSFIAACQKPR